MTETIENGVRPLRVVSWNMNHWRQSRVPVDTHALAWQHLRATLGTDVGLLQEALPPVDQPRWWSAAEAIAGGPAFARTSMAPVLMAIATRYLAVIGATSRSPSPRRPRVHLGTG